MMLSNQLCYLLVLLTVLCVACTKETIVLSESPQSDAKVVRFPQVTDVQFSHSGRFGYFQLSETFVVFETERLPNNVGELREHITLPGKAICFLPSDQIIYIDKDRAFLFDPGERKSKDLGDGEFPQMVGGRADPTHHLVAVVSNELLITGDGSYDWGGKKGNIWRFDPQTGSLRRGALIHGFWLASLSPDKSYLVYEYGAEENNSAYLYDVARDRNWPIADYFDFTKNFKNVSDSNETPVKWLIATNRFIALISDGSDVSDEAEQWIVLFDVESRSVVWKEKLAEWFFPTDLHVIDDVNALVLLRAGLHTLNLRTGKMEKKSGLEAEAMALSTDAKRLAFISDNKLFVSDVSGKDHRLLLELDPAFRFQTAYKGMGMRDPKWSPKENAVFVFGENEMVMVRL